MLFFFIIQMSILCELLDLCSLSESGLHQACKHFASIAVELPHSHAKCFAELALLPKVRIRIHDNLRNSASPSCCVHISIYYFIYSLFLDQRVRTSPFTFPPHQFCDIHKTLWTSGYRGSFYSGATYRQVW